MKPLPGFRDFPPEECARRNHLFRVFRTVARAFDFREYDAPILEPLDLYVEKSGEEIVRQLFHFTDKGIDLLRPDPNSHPLWPEWSFPERIP